MPAPHGQSSAWEVDACARGAIDYIELPVAFDGLAVIVNPDNDWVDQLDIEELREIWRPGSTVEKWSDVRPGVAGARHRAGGSGYRLGDLRLLHQGDGGNRGSLPL